MDGQPSTIRRRSRKKGPFCLYIPKGEHRDLTEVEKAVSLAQFSEWLAGRMPSEAIRDDARREPLEIERHMAENAASYVRHSKRRVA
jgi:hypothetical protein